MRAVALTVLAANLIAVVLGLAGVIGTAPSPTPFEPEVPGFRGRLLEQIKDQPVAPQAADPFVNDGACLVTTTPMDSSAARQLLARWQALGVEGRAVRDQRNGTVLGYWVLTEAVENRDQLIDLQRTIESQGFPALLQQGGENAQRISVGFFRREENALRHRDRLRGAGFDVSLVPRRLAAGGVLIAARSQMEAAVVERMGATVRSISCADLAAMETADLG